MILEFDWAPGTDESIESWMESDDVPFETLVEINDPFSWSEEIPLRAVRLVLAASQARAQWCELFRV